MQLPTFDTNVSNHQSLPDKPAMSAGELKRIFDKAPEDIKNYINTVLIPQIERQSIEIKYGTGTPTRGSKWRYLFTIFLIRM